jgi:hypothetical protein
LQREAVAGLVSDKSLLTASKALAVYCTGTRPGLSSTSVNSELLSRAIPT